MPPPMFNFTGDSSFALLKLRGGLGPVAIMLVTYKRVMPSVHICISCFPKDLQLFSEPVLGQHNNRVPLTVLLALLLEEAARHLPGRACPLAACDQSQKRFTAWVLAQILHEIQLEISIQIRNTAVYNTVLQAERRSSGCTLGLKLLTLLCILV